MNEESDEFKTMKDLLEKMFDMRYQYLREREYENHSFCSKILKQYEESVKEFYNFIKKR